MPRNKIKSGVYKITCLKNNKIYIGSSKNISKRFSSHKNQLKNKKHHNYFLQKDWIKYGKENFKFEILELCEPNKRFDLEQKYLDEIKPFYYNNGYNIQETTTEVYDGFKICVHEPNETDGRGYIHRGFGFDKMPITEEDLKDKTKEQLKDEYLGWINTRDIWEDMIICNPDLAEQ